MPQSFDVDVDALLMDARTTAVDVKVQLAPARTVDHALARGLRR